MATNATAPDLHRLLDLQTEDSTIKRLEERRSALPEAARLAELNDQLAELTSDIEMASKQSAEIGREQNRLEGDISVADQKIAKEEQRLFSGNVSNPKELGSLQAEVEMLKRKKAEIEDRLLEVMVEKDQAVVTEERLRSEQEELSGEVARLTKLVGELMHDIEAQLSDHSERRALVAGEVAADLLGLYDQIRASKGGVAVAALEAGTCQGCHTQLAHKEVERLKAAGGLQRCDNCRRILVVD